MRAVSSAVCNTPSVGSGAGLVKAQQHLFAFDLGSVFHQDLFDDPALQVLDLFAVALHHHDARRNDRARKRSGRGPRREPRQRERDDN
jgi:hypothetical protein